MKYITLLLLLLNISYAETRSPNELNNIAKNWLTIHTHDTNLHIENENNNRLLSQNSDEKPLNYKIITFSPKGWIMISTDDVVHPVLAYSFESSIDSMLNDVSFKVYRVKINKEIEILKDIHIENDADIALWEALSSDEAENTRLLTNANSAQKDFYHFEKNPYYWYVSRANKMKHITFKKHLDEIAKVEKLKNKSALTPPPVPTGFHVADIRLTSAALVWNRSNSPLVTGYKVYYPNGRTSSHAKRVTEEYIFELSGNHEYTFEIATISAAGVESERSRVTFTTHGERIRPSVFSYLPDNHYEPGSTVTFSWVNHGIPWEDFELMVYDSNHPNGRVLKEERVDWEKDSQIPRLHNVTVTLPREFTKARLRIRFSVGATLGGGGNIFFYTRDKNIYPLDPAIPAAPSNLNISNITKQSATLTWRDNSSRETGYRIFERNGNTPPIELPANTTTATINIEGLASGMFYGYRVQSYRGDINCTNTPLEIFRTLGPRSPANLEASDITATTATLSWRDYSDNETGFRISRDGSSRVIEVAANVTSQDLSGLSPQTIYRYTIKAYNSDGESSFERYAIFRTHAVPDRITAPRNLRVSSVTANSVTLTWSDNSNNETGFKIYRSGSSTPMIVPANTTSKVIRGLRPDTNYTYTVKAYNSGGESEGVSTTFTTQEVIRLIPTITFNIDVPNSWTVDEASEHRTGRYAKYYQFTLTQSQEVIINLSSTTDTYLYLLSGDSQTSPINAQDDDGGEGHNSRIIKILSAGTYVIEASTYHVGQTGDFSVSVTTESTTNPNHNLIINPSFESTSGNQAIGWKGYGINSYINTTVSQAHTGSKAVRITHSSKGNSAFKGTEINVNHAHRLKFTGWSKSENVSAGAAYGVYYLITFEDGSHGWYIIRFYTGTHDWQKIERTKTFSKKVVNVKPYIILFRALGTVWFDDISVEVL